MKLRILAALGAVFVFLTWLRNGASLRDAFLLTRMGATPISGGATSDWITGSPETVKRWAAQAWVELPKLIYWTKFMGKGLNACIQQKDELQAKPGDLITFSFIKKLTGVGTDEDAQGVNGLEGAEEAISPFTDTVGIKHLRHGVRLKGRLSEKRTAYDQRVVAKDLLTTWMAETIDKSIFTAFDLNTHATHFIYGGAATSTATIAAGDYMTTALLTKAKTKAKKADSVTSSGKIWPIKVGTDEYYVAVISPDQEHDLKVHDASWAQAQREAQNRGKDNPIFTGALGIWDGVIIHSHENISTPVNWGAGGTLTGALGMFVGRQAGAFAWGFMPSWVEKEFDYGNSTGFAVGACWGMKKAIFNAFDHAFFSLATYRTNN
jgi:N4-gp56 family major capsid protein